MPSIPKPETGRGAIVELFVIVALAIGLALIIQAFLVKPFQIPSGSMEPTLDVGQRVLVNRTLFHFEDPEVGDIVVFHPPAGAQMGQECGVPHDPAAAVPRADRPTARTRTSSSASSPAPGTGSTSRTATRS